MGAKKGIKQPRKPTEQIKKLVQIEIDQQYKPDSERLNKSEMLKKAGYTPTNYDALKTDTHNTLMVQALESAGLNDEAAAKKLRIILDDEDPRNADKALGHYFKIKGSYAPTKTEHKEEVDVKYTVEQDKGDYLEYMKQRNMDRQVIEGTIEE